MPNEHDIRARAAEGLDWEDFDLFKMGQLLCDRFNLIVMLDMERAANDRDADTPMLRSCYPTGRAPQDDLDTNPAPESTKAEKVAPEPSSCDLDGLVKWARNRWHMDPVGAENLCREGFAIGRAEGLEEVAAAIHALKGGA